MDYEHREPLTILRLSGLVLLSLSLMVGCTTMESSKESTKESASSETSERDPAQLPLVEDTEGDNDPEVKVADAGAPQDCVEKDERAACQVRPRAFNFVPVKLKSESRNRCLRPSRGSSNENARIILSRCSNSKSRYWFKKPAGGYANTYRLENMNSGKCIQRVGNALRQRTCAQFSGSDSNNQRWYFQSTPPFGSGDFIGFGVNSGNCMRANNNNTVSVSNCQNDSNRRWYQSAF